MVSGSLLQLNELIPTVGGLSIVEEIGILLAVVLLLERTMTGDFRVRRSYFAGPLLLVAFVLFFSWFRGSIITQRYVGVLEAHEAFALPFFFFLISNTFRDESDRDILIKIIIWAAIAKCLDGLSVQFFSHDVSKSWGVIQLWRDAYLISVGILAGVVFLHYRGTALKKLQWVVIAATPLMVAVMILGYRRTAMVATLGAILSMFVTLPKQRRGRQAVALGAFLLSFVLLAIIINPLNVFLRLSGIVAPAGEGSAYIRLLELPNVLQNIWQHPILGVPVGIPWKTYYRMPISAVYTTLGTHNAYLYWPLRAGITGLVAFVWLFGCVWKSVLISFRLRRTEEDFFYGQFLIQCLVIYGAASFFGIMYGDYMSSMMAVLFVMIQLHAKQISGRWSYRDVALIATLRSGQITFTRRAIRRLQPIAA